MFMLVNRRHHVFSFSLTIVILTLTNILTIVHCSDDGDTNNQVPLEDSSSATTESRQHLDAERDSLKRELENVKNQLNDYKKSMAMEKTKASEDIQNCQEQIATKESQINDMSKKTTSLENEHERELTELRTTIERTKKEAEMKAIEVQNLEKQVVDMAELKTTIETMTKDANIKAKQIADLETQSTTVADLKKTIATMTKDADTKAKTIQNLEKQMTEMTELKTTIKTMTKEADLQTKKIQTLEKQTETMTKDANSKAKTIANLETQSTTLAELKKTIETMTNDANSQTTTINNLEKQMAKMTKEHATVRHNLLQMERNATRHYCNMTLIKSDSEKFLHDSFDTLASTTERFLHDAYGVLDVKSRPLRTTVANWGAEQSKKVGPAYRMVKDKSFVVYETGRDRAAPFVRQGSEMVGGLYEEHAAGHVGRGVDLVKEFYTEFAEDTVNEVIVPFYNDTVKPLLGQHVYPVVIRARDAVVGVRVSLISGVEDKMRTSIDYINTLKKEKDECAITKGCDANDVKIPRDWVVDIINAIETNATQIMDTVLILVFIVTMGRFVLFLAWSIVMFPFRVMWFFSPLRIILDYRRRRANRKVNRAEKRAAEKKAMKSSKKSGEKEHVNGSGSSKKKNRKLK